MKNTHSFVLSGRILSFAASADFPESMKAVRTSAIVPDMFIWLVRMEDQTGEVRLSSVHRSDQRDVLQCLTVMQSRDEGILRSFAWPRIRLANT